MTGEYLKTLRENKRLSQRELSAKLGLSCPYICQLEQGNRKPGDKAVFAYSEFFGIPLTAFVKNLNDDIPSDEWVEAAFEVWQDTANRGFPRAPRNMPVSVKLFALEIAGWV
jgi:transcriptional regulator with XRE-family HTH domain